MYRVGLMTTDDECLEGLYLNIEQSGEDLKILDGHSRKYETQFKGNSLS